MNSQQQGKFIIMDTTNRKANQRWSCTCLLLGCLLMTACAETPTFSTAGKVEFAGRPVYPATLLFQDAEGNVLPTSTTDDGTFRLFEVRKGKYRVAVQTPKLANMGGGQRAQGDQSPEAAGTREATVPEKFKNAFTAIPQKYEDFSTSDLEFDFSDSVQQDLQIVLKE